MLVPRLFVYQGKVATCEEYTIDLLKDLVKPLTAFLGLPEVVADVDGAGS